MKRFPILFLILFFHECVNAKLPDLIPYRKGNLWGYCDSTKKIIVPVKYDYADRFWGNTAVAVYKGKQVIVDLSGNELFLADSISIMCSEAHFTIRTFKNKRTNASGLINEKGNIIFMQENLTLLWLSEKYLYGYRDSKIAVYDFQGRMILDYKYISQDFVEYGYGRSDENADNGKFIMYDRKGNYGVVDTMGKVIIPFVYFAVDYSGCGYYSAAARDSFFTIDSNGRILWRAARRSKKDLRRHRNIYGYEAVPTSPLEQDCWTKKANIFSHQFYGLNSTKTKYKYGILNSIGDTIVKAKYDRLDHFEENSLANVWKVISQDKWGNIEKEILLGYVDVYGTEYWEE